MGSPAHVGTYHAIGPAVVANSDIGRMFNRHGDRRRRDRDTQKSGVIVPGGDY
jgi:hypothetical protein